jgi:hypothetical protein
MLLETPRVEVGSRISFSVEQREGVVIDVPGDALDGCGVAAGHVRVQLDDGSQVDVSQGAIIACLPGLAEGWPKVSTGFERFQAVSSGARGE